MVAVREVEFRKRRLNAIFERASALAISSETEEIVSDYARHICVLMSGFVEKAVGEIVLEYARDKGPAQLLGYLDFSLRRLTNVDKDRLLNIVGAFDSGWRLEMDRFVIDERQAAINSVVGLKNDIAHGGTSSVSLRQVEKYWLGVQEIIDKLSDLMLRDQQGRVVTRARRAK